MKVEINHNGVFLDGKKIDRATRVDIMNINLVEEMDVVIHVSAEEIKVDYQLLGIRE